MTEDQDPSRSVVADDRSGQPDKVSSTGYSKLDYDRAWVRLRRTIDRGNLIKLLGMRCNKLVLTMKMLFSTEMRIPQGTERIIHDGSGQLNSANSQEEADSETFVMGSDAAEFSNKVKDQVRSKQKRISNVAGDGEEHSMIWGMFMAVTMESAVFTGKNCQDNQNSIMNTTDLTLKKCSTYLQNWWADKMRSSMWIRFIGKNIYGKICH